MAHLILSVDEISNSIQFTLLQSDIQRGFGGCLPHTRWSLAKEETTKYPPEQRTPKPTGIPKKIIFLYNILSTNTFLSININKVGCKFDIFRFF